MKFLLEPIKNVPKIDELYCFVFRSSMFNSCSENCPAKVQKIELGARRWHDELVRDVVVWTKITFTVPLVVQIELGDFALHLTRCIGIDLRLHHSSNEDAADAVTKAADANS